MQDENAKGGQIINKKIPVTVITGFLGAGKTTLINSILGGKHGIKFAIIENEFGEIGIDNEILEHAEEEIVEMNNGCICCTVRGDLINIIKKLLARDVPPEHIIIETTGLADPSPVAQTFLTDSELMQKTYLDSILTIVDVKHMYIHLDSNPQYKDQIAFADTILLNKIDLVDAKEIEKIENNIVKINRFAKIHQVQNSIIDIKKILGINGFDVEKALDVNSKFLEIEYPFEYGALYNFKADNYTLELTKNGDEDKIKILLGPMTRSIKMSDLITIANPLALLFSEKNQDILLDGMSIPQEQQVFTYGLKDSVNIFKFNLTQDSNFFLFSEHHAHEFDLKIKNTKGELIEPAVSHDFKPEHEHDDEVSSVGIEIKGELDPAMFIYYIDTIIKDYGVDLYRYKGVIAINGEDKKIVLQGVHMLFNMTPSKDWNNEEKISKIIFIGKNLDRDILTQGFISCKIK